MTVTRKFLKVDSSFTKQKILQVALCFGLNENKIRIGTCGSSKMLSIAFK